MTGHAPKRGRTMEQRAWRWMREREWVRTIELATQFGWEQYVARAVLRRLQAKGCVIARGNSNARRYSATETAPEDMRGSAPGSVAALKVVAKQRRNPAKRRYHPRTEPGIELERVWRRAPARREL